MGLIVHNMPGASRKASNPVRVSVIIPCFNSAATVAETVESVISQSARDLEIVLVDDGSTDATRGLIERLIGDNPDTRMRLVEQPNAGVASARNRGIALAQGRYILPLDADDLIAATMVEQCASVLDSAPEIDLVYTDRQDFGDIDAVRTAGIFAIERLKYFNQIGYCTLFRRSMWQAIGGYRSNVSGFDDWDFWLAAALHGFRARHLPQPLFRHRRRRDSLLWRLLPDFERLHAQIILNNKRAYSECEVSMAAHFIETGEEVPVLRSARFVFLAHYFKDYASSSAERSCG